MKNDNRHTEADRRYAAAYEAHYTTTNSREALELYKGIITDYPNTQEAEYCRSQIRNIINTVVSKQALFDAQVDLVLAQFEQGDQPPERRAPVATSDSSRLSDADDPSVSTVPSP